MVEFVGIRNRQSALEGEGGAQGAGPPAASHGLAALLPARTAQTGSPPVSGGLVGGPSVFAFFGGFRGPAGSFRGCLAVAASALLNLEAAECVVVEGGMGTGSLLPCRAV